MKRKKKKLTDAQKRFYARRGRVVTTTQLRDRMNMLQELMHLSAIRPAVKI